MNTCFPWKYGSVFLLTLALVGCYDYHHDDVEVCTSSSDEPVETCPVVAAFPPVPQCES